MLKSVAFKDNPEVDQQLESIVPSRELLLHYKEKLSELEKEFQELGQKVNRCQDLCERDFQMQQKLQRRASDVAHLQQALSDMQVYLHQEREQGLRFRIQNDRLKVQLSEGNQKIECLMKLMNITPCELATLMRNQMPHPHGNGRGTRTPSADWRTTAAMESNNIHSDFHAELENRLKVHESEMSSLLRDREAMKMEHEATRRRLEHEVDKLSKSLKELQDQLCNVTKDLVIAKSDNCHTEISWAEEKNKLLRRLQLCRQRLGERSPSESGSITSGGGTCFASRSSRQELCAQVDILKGQLKERDKLVAMYEENYTQANDDSMKYKEQLERCRKHFRDQLQNLVGEMSYIKNKYKELDRRRRLEAEGFFNDLKILRGRLQNLEKNARRVNRQGSSHSVPSISTEFTTTDRDTISMAGQLGSELREIRLKLKQLENNLNTVKPDQD